MWRRCCWPLGHAIVEVFDRQLGKWIFLDVFNNAQAIDNVSRSP